MKLIYMLFLLTGPLFAVDEVVGRFVDYTRQHPDGEAPNSFERSAYAGDTSRLPIGVFDSGIGGLTVLEAILELDAFDNKTLKPSPDGIPDFADERFIYFGDQANMPYGNYPKAGRTDFLRELALKDLAFMLGKRFTVDGKVRLDKPPVKAIVIACNTATAYGLDDIRAVIGNWGLPVIVVGVVEAGARGVRESNINSSRTLAVMATAGTCDSGAYPRMITRSLGLAGRPVPTVIQQGGVNLAATIEGDPAAPRTVPEESEKEVEMLLEKNRESGSPQPIGTVVLGCTHYPLAQNDIEKAFAKFREDARYSGLVAPDLVFVDPARWTATELFRELALARLRMKPGDTCVMPSHQFFMSVANPACQEARLAADGTLDKDYKYGREPGHLEVEDTRVEIMMPDRIPKSSQQLVENKLPKVWNFLSAAAGMTE